MNFIEFGGWLFWLTITAIIIWDIFSIENDSGWMCFWGTALGLFALWYFTGTQNPVPWFSENWATILMSVIGYIVLGAGWGVAKWWFFLHNEADDYELKRERYQTEFAGMTDVGKAAYAGGYKEWLAKYYDFPPSPGNNKAEIFMWMTWWPISATWTLLHDPLKRIGTAIYNSLYSTYTKIANAVFAGRFTELQ